MNTHRSNFGELRSFKSTLAREKTQELPTFEGITVTLSDYESGVEFALPVLLIKSMRPLGDGTLIRLIDGGKHHVKGSVQNVCHEVIEAKIKGGHN